MVDNQHKKIAGYRDLTEEEIEYMNRVKAAAILAGDLISDLREVPGIDHRWLSIGMTDLQQGFMAVTRAIAKPDTF